MVWISTMTVVELASATGLTLAGIAGLIKASNCRRVEYGIRGLVCEKELVIIEDVETGSSNQKLPNIETDLS